jgi:hypothetical protein
MSSDELDNLLDVMFDGDPGPAVLTHRIRTALLSAEERYKPAMLALESLTPSGSEYVGDVERCVATIRDTRRRQHEMIVKFKKERDRALAALRDNAIWNHLLAEHAGDFDSCSVERCVMNRHDGAVLKEKQ